MEPAIIILGIIGIPVVFAIVCMAVSVLGDNLF